jgi:hypothetical protein
MTDHRPAATVLSSLMCLPDRSGLGSLAEQLVQLTGANGRDQGIDRSIAKRSSREQSHPADETGPALT